jgi:hypothetical protein
MRTRLTCRTMTSRCFRTIRFRALAALVWAAVLLGMIFRPASAQAQILFSPISVDFTYGDLAAFEGQVKLAAEVRDLWLFIQPSGEGTRTVKVNLDEEGKLNYSYDLKQHPLRPFARIDYWLVAITNGNQQVASEKYSFMYIDNRQPWQTLDNGHFQVNWLAGDLSFGQAVLNTAETGAVAASKLLPGQDLNIKGLKIFVFDSAARMQAVLNYSPADWVVGEANPDLGVVLVSIPAGIDQQLEMDRQIPHEIMHVLTYKIVTQNYTKVPVWLSEGLASLAETYSNPDYQRTLVKAAKANSLVAMGALCSEFPQDAAGAFQAYAQSASFTQFLQNKFGSSGLLDLVNTYKNGYSCEDGVQVSTGSSLNQLDYRWRQETLGVDTGTLAVQNLAPYLSVAALLLVIPFLAGGLMWKRKP